MWFYKEDSPATTWTCSPAGCSTCEGSYCFWTTVEVKVEGAARDDLESDSDCRYGDTVKLLFSISGSVSIDELVILGKQGTNG